MNLRPRYILATLILALLQTLSFGSSVSAEREYSIDRDTVKIQVNVDSSVNVSEELQYTFNGEFNGMYREITLGRQTCPEGKQCGGFSWINIDKVYVDGAVLDKTQYEKLTVTKSGEERLRVQYRFGSGPVELVNETHTFKLEYTVLGSIGRFADYDLFYWNALFSDRDVEIKEAEVIVNYPSDFSTEADSSQVFGVDKYTTVKQRNTIKYSVKEVQPQEDFTILQKISSGVIKPTGSVQLELLPEQQIIGYRQFTMSALSGDTIEGLPLGKATLEFTADGYKPQNIEIEIGGTTKNVRVVLEETPETKFKNIVILIVNLCGLCLAPLGLVAIYFYWRNRGRDKINRPVVIPEFTPPDNIKPYLLGTLKDETADNVDITATIIDLAYLGYLKIEEESNSNFKLIRTDKAEDDLNPVEKKILNGLFQKSNETTIQAISLEFAKQLVQIKNDIYQELSDRKYFSHRPDRVRGLWLGLGTIIIILSLIVGSFLLNTGIFTCIFSGLCIGLVVLIASKFMPAKTEIGGQILQQVKGFKMYLETAEKYTIQNLTPDTFERYLSYALVFGIEKTWADKFKDIYTGQPDWYSSDHTFNTLILANSLRNFNTTANNTINMATIQNNSSSGKGWSGGGGFSGGFSGGGGGGGGGGAW